MTVTTDPRKTGIAAAVASQAVKVYNPKGLRDFSQRLATASYQPVDIIALGHSFVWGVGINGYPSPSPDIDTVASRLDGWIPELRDGLNRHMGTVTGGEWIHAMEARCTRASGTNLLGYGVLCGGVQYDMYGLSTGASQVTFPIVVGAGGAWAIDVVHWEDSAASYVGAAEISLDGATWTTIDRVSSSSSSVHQYRSAVLSNIAAGTYNCVIRWLATYAGKNFGLCGIKVYNAAGGVNVMRNGTGTTGSGAATYDWVLAGGTGTQQGRIRPATYQTRPADLFIIQGPHNDCTRQITDGLTPAQSVTNLRIIIDAILTNGKTWAATRKTSILLVTEGYPDNTTTLNIPAGGTFSRSDYWDAWQAVADIYPDNVAVLRMADAVGTYAQANAGSLYYDGIHWNRKGYRVQGRALTAALVDSGQTLV